MRFVIAFATFFFVLSSLGATCIAVVLAFRLGFLLFVVGGFVLCAAAVIGVTMLIARVLIAATEVKPNPSAYARRLALAGASGRRR
jgi:hypothetical protein